MNATPASARSALHRLRESGLLEPDGGARALARAIPAVGAGWRLVACRPQRLEVGEDIGLTGEIRLAPAGSRVSRLVAFEVVTADPRPGPWEGRDPESGFTFRLSPADRRLPLLASALDVAPRSDQGPAGSGLAAAELVAHRFGRRAVLKVGGAQRGPIWVKLWAKNRAARVAGLHDRLLGQPGLRVARVRHHDPRGGLVAFEPLEGAPLSESLSRSEAAVGALLARTVRAVSAIDPGDLAPWGTEQERANLHSFVGRAARVSRDRAARITARVAAFEREETPPPGGRRGLVHRDLHDKQVILGGGAPGILDWDLAAAGPSALDAGNLLAHFGLRALQAPAAATRIRSVARAFADTWCAGPEDVPALSWWARIALLRLACVYTLRPGAEALADAILSAVDEPLAGEPRS